jgi:hypothetical protein
MICLIAVFALVADGRFDRARLSGTEIVLEFSTATNSVFVLDSAQSVPGPWSETRIFAGTGSNASITHQIAEKARFFRARVFPRTISSKPGTPIALSLALPNSSAQWSAEGEMPAGIAFANGHFSGTPTAEAPEQFQSGNYTNIIQLEGGAGGSAEFTHHVRLSYSRNIFAARPNGPSFGSICIKCHGSGFAPDFTADASTIINRPATSASEGECSDEWRYIVPGDLPNSLIYQKVVGPPCGDRMPQGGPFFTATQIEQLARWIADLEPGDTD